MTEAPDKAATLQQAREVIDMMVEEEFEEVFKLFIQVTEHALENGNLKIAHCLIVRRPDGQFDFTPAAQTLIDLGYIPVLLKAVRLIAREEEGWTDAEIDSYLEARDKERRAKEN